MDHHALGTRSRIATALLFASLVSMPTLLAAADAPAKRTLAARFSELHGQKIADARREVEMFVRFDQPSVAELNVASLRANGSFASPAEQKAQAARVSQQQAAMSDSLASHGAKILSSQRVGANGVRVLVSADSIATLRALPGVRSVGRVQTFKKDNIDSVPWIGAPAVWAASGRGEGVKIGIIDSGIDYTHKDFGGSGIVADHDSNNPNIIEPGTFPTAKVKGGYDFAGSNYDADDPASVPVPDPDPIDYGPGGGHGTHVAGTAAGIGVAGSVGPGVAPGASLYAIKVFGDSGGSTNLVSLALEWAMDPNDDGDMSDHLDVINMSLGSPFGDPNDPSAVSSQNAADLGIIVVASAGNEGTIPYITGSPAVAPEAISVAASKPGGGSHLYSRFAVTAPAALAGLYESAEGAGPVTLASTGPISGALVKTVPANGCTPLTNAAAVSGQIAFVIRGVCSFVDKYKNAAAAGAKALVVYNDGADPTRVDPIIMLADGTTIPGVMVGAAIGFALAAAPSPAATLSVAPDADVISTFSSLGPGGGGSSFKPDLAAPGEAIVSAGMGTGTGSLELQGTSMAAPHVTGAAALLRQLHPKLDQSGIKALLQNSTVPAPLYDKRVTRTGTGIVRVDRAAALTSFASPGGVSFGRLNPLFTINRDERVKLTNLSGKSRNFKGKHIAGRTYPGVEVECPSSLHVRPKGTTRFDIDLKFDPRKAFRKGVFDDAFSSQTEVDGWCEFSDGKDTLRVAYIAVVDAASAVLTLPGRKFRSVNLFNAGPALGTAEAFTLAKLGSEGSEGGPGAQISAVGFRNADPSLFFGFPTLEFGIALAKPFEHLSTFEFDLLIDTNGDGVEDVILVGVDQSRLIGGAAPGAFITAQLLPTGAGFVDWVVQNWDHNDRTLILPFTLTTGGGLLPKKFDYTLITFAGDGSVDTQVGSVDLANEIVPDLNSFTVDPGGNVNVQMTGPTGYTLWLLQNDIVPGQVGLSFNAAPKN